MLKIFKRLKRNKEKKLRLIQLKKIHIKELIVQKCLKLKRWIKALMVKHSL